MSEIEEAARVIPALYLRKLVLHVDGQNRCAEAQEVDASFLGGVCHNYIRQRNRAASQGVGGLPHDGAEMPLTARAAPLRAGGGAKNRMEAFFVKPVDDEGINVHREGASSSRAPSSTPAKTAGSARRTRSRR